MPLTMTRRTVTFEVLGIAQPKGSSKAHVPMKWAIDAVRAGHAPRAIVTSANPKMKDWQHLVAEQAQRVAGDGLFVGPIALAVMFHLPRPASLPKRVRHHCKQPDVDKLARAILDSLTGILYRDDAQVVDLEVHKLYAAIASAPRACITVAEAAPPPALSQELFS